jgi:NAD(P)-dependent dehydrogenase (short-subunit alcohol dehydrogenase family)
MDNRFENKVAVVTGGASGIGGDCTQDQCRGGQAVFWIDKADEPLVSREPSHRCG